MNRPAFVLCLCAILVLSLAQNSAGLTTDEAIMKIIAESLGVQEDKVVPSANLATDLGADSDARSELNEALRDSGYHILLADQAKIVNDQSYTVQDVIHNAVRNS